MSKIVINKALATKVLKVVDKGLTSGQGEPTPGRMCVEAAVNFALGLPHGDEPPCVGLAVRDFKIELNDCHWSSHKARAKGLREIAVAQLGSVDINQNQFKKKLFDQLKPKLVEFAISKTKNNPTAAEVMGFMMEKIRESSNGQTWYDELSRYASELELHAIADAVECYSYTSCIETAAVFWHDQGLCLCADACRDVLIEMKSPGAKFLSLCRR